MEEGPRLVWHMGIHAPRGCLISVAADGQIHACEETHACGSFDCSYLRALLLNLDVIQGYRQLPEFDLILNAGDVTLHDASDLPTFTRTGTSWATRSFALPFEWQLHPGQCHKQLIKWALVSMKPWEARLPQLIWRGSNSNCRFVHCNATAVSEGEASEAVECSRATRAPVRDCAWNFTTWLQMPRGRLVWQSRFHPAIDAKLVPLPSQPLAPDLEAFLSEEGLLGSHSEQHEQGLYKYVIAVEGDSAADRLYWQLFSGSVVLIPRGPWRVLPLFDLLVPYEHFVPLRSDLSDLPEKVDWLRANDDKAEHIARSGAFFAQRYLTCDGILNYVSLLLRAYAARLTD